MQVILLALLLLFSSQLTLLNAQQKQTKPLTHTFIQTETDKITDKLVALRRGFHEKPELAGKEKLTQETIIQYLTGLGLEVKTDLYGHSVVGILHGGKKGKKIAWRADMDALPTDFPDEVAFKSTIKGVQHGCGHDIHMAIALGIAKVLAKNKKELPGTVYFIFQPEEETFKGAKNMLAKGLLDQINPDEIYGLHVTALPVGEIMVKPGEMFAYQKRIRILLKNELSKEEAKALTKKIHSTLSRSTAGSRPWEIQNIRDPKTGLTNPNTIFKDYLIMDEQFTSYTKNDSLFLEAYVYETNATNLANIIPAVKQVIAAGNNKDQLLNVSFIQENPTIINDKTLTADAITTLQNIYGKNAVAADYGQVPFFNDDFAYFQQKVPGVYFFLGGSNAAKGINALNHSPGFKVDEDCIKTGVKSFASLLFERLKKK